jgi:hypothetical protein
MTPSRLGAVLFLVTVALGSDAQQPFRAALSGELRGGCDITPISFPRLQWVAPDHVDYVTDVFQIASSGNNDHVFALVLAPVLTIVRIQPDGTRTPFYQQPGVSASTFAVAPDGRVYLPLHDGAGFRLAIISAAGVLQTTLPLPVTEHPYATVAAHDGCTVFLLENLGTHIRRFNACTGVMLPDIFPGHYAVDVAPLPNGQILLAEEKKANLYDANGVFIRTVATVPASVSSESIGQVAVSNDLRDVWLTASGCGIQGVLLRFSFSTGMLISEYELALNSPNALVIGSATSDVPLGPHALILLAIALAAVAVLRL